MEPDDLGHHIGRRAVERHTGQAGGTQIVGELGQAFVDAEEGVRREPGGDHPLRHENALGDHEPFSGPAARQGGKVGPTVDGVEVAEVVDTRVVGIVDVDDVDRQRAGGHGLGHAVQSACREVRGSTRVLVWARPASTDRLDPANNLIPRRHGIGRCDTVVR